MEKEKDFNEWRAEKLGYVCLSRFNDLIIKESSAEVPFFDYLIDVGENGKQTGRLFGVEVKALNGTPISLKTFADKYKNISFPILLLVFNNKTDEGCFRWIKEPKNDGRLLLNSTTDKLIMLENDSLSKIVQQVKDWYAHQAVSLG